MCQSKPGSLDLTQATAAIRDTIVQIDIVSPNISGLYEPIGSGFLVSRDGYVVTAGQVIRRAETRLRQIPVTEKHLAVAIPNPRRPGSLDPGSFTFVVFDIVEADDQSDVALLKLIRNPFGAGPLATSVKTVEFAGTEPRNGEAVAVSGYPYPEATLVTDSGIVTNATATIPGRALMPRFSGNTYRLDLEANAGNAGAPVYEVATGKVTGICTTAFQEAAASQGRAPVRFQTNVVPARYIVQMLKKHKINTAAAPAP